MHLFILVLYLVSFTAGVVLSPTSTGASGSSVSSISNPSSTLLDSESVDCTDVSSSSEISPTCWNSLDMQDWMFHWNVLSNCKQSEIWSSCFLNLAFEGTEYDCSMLGSLNCTAPELGEVPHEAHAFYGAYNIWGMHKCLFLTLSTSQGLILGTAVEQYFLIWQTALYATSSQPAINNIVQILDVKGAPILTVSSLLSSIVTHYGINSGADELLVSMLPVGKKASPLDMGQTYMSPQLGDLLSDTLLTVMTDPLKMGFLLLVRDGQMMQNSTKLLSQLKANIAGIS